MSTAAAALTSTIFGNQNPRRPIWMEISHSPAANGGRRSFVTRATASSTGKEKKSRPKRKNKRKEVPEEEKSPPENGEMQGVSTASTPDSVSAIKSRLDEVNPVGLGRKSRQIFDEVWRKFSGLGQISRTTRKDDDEAALLLREGGPMCEFAIPGAQNTTVLVVGATSRVGRLVVRKLMLRGYTVKVILLQHYKLLSWSPMEFHSMKLDYCTCHSSQHTFLTHTWIVSH